jgi:hypothetical protein
MKRLLLIFLVSLPLPLLAQSTLLEPSHPVYDFLDRMETLGLLEHPLLGSKPVTRERIAELLDEVGGKVLMKGIFSGQGFPLSGVDLRALEAFRWEFHQDAVRSEGLTLPAPFPEGRSRWGAINNWMHDRGWFTDVFYRNGLNLFSSESEDFDVYADPRGEARIIRQKGDDRNIVITSMGFQVRGYVQDKIGLMLDFRDNTERGRGPYLSRSQLYEDRAGYVANLNRGIPLEPENSANYDITLFDFSLGGKYWELHGARMPLRWGPGRSGQLLLSDWGPPFHQVQFNLNLGKTLRLAYVFGSLETFPLISDSLYTHVGYTRTIEHSKYLAAHRLEWDPHPRLRLAFSESVIFGDRNPELAYLIPINFFYSAQHDLGDEDNFMMSLEATWIPVSRLKAYGQLLIDDVTLGKLGTDWYGNKLGWLGGLNWVEPLGVANVDATLEMAQIRPFVYTHQYPVNVYKNWNAPLGYHYGPNSQPVMTDLRWRPHRRLALEATWTNLLHGANPDSLHNAGGDINQPHALNDPTDVPFLGGLKQTTNRVDLSATYEALEHLYFWGRGGWIRFDGADGWEAEVGFRLN